MIYLIFKNKTHKIILTGDKFDVKYFIIQVLLEEVIC